MVDSPASDTAEMVPSISEAKDSIEDEPRTETMEKVDETVATAYDPDTTTMERVRRKKKKKKDPSGASSSELPKGEASDGNDNGTSKTDETREKDSNGESKHSSAEESPDKGKNVVQNDPSAGPVVSATKRTRPSYKYDPEKVTLRFLFANRDGLTVTAECKPDDTVGEVKGQLLSVWPEDLQTCSGGDQLRLICMGKGILMPDSKTLKQLEIPVFKTHPTPVNVAVRPKAKMADYSKSGKDGGSRGGGSSRGSSNTTTVETGQGCGCVIS